MQKKEQKNWFKFVVGFILCMLVRMIPFRAPNLEPILATQMPFARHYGPIAGFLFAFLSVFLFDLMTNFGIWTLVVSVVYGSLGVFSYFFFKKHKNSRKNYVLFAVLGTLYFDAVTGLTIGPIFFGQSFLSALIGQIPFTMLHLAGNIAFAFFLSPLIDKILNKNTKFSLNIISSFNYNYKKI